VVCGRPRLTLVIACDSRCVHHDGVACLLIDVTIIVRCGCGLLAVLFAPLLASLGALLSILDGDGDVE
jgi:hypothetical protein